MSYEIATAPTAEPVTLTEVKAHLRISGTDEDALLAIYITAAREFIESYTNRALMPQTVKQYYNRFPTDAIELRLTPVTDVTSVKYKDTSGSQQTVSAADYQKNIISQPAYIRPVTSWPETDCSENNVVIEFVAGHADQSSVPAKIKEVILLLIGEMYENRENTVKKLPTAVEYYLTALKVHLL